MPSQKHIIKERNRLRAKLTRLWLNEIKLQRGCKVCGYKKDARALQFDHRDPSEKLFDVSQMKNCARWKIMDEVEKCDVLCANCHATKTFENKDHVNGGNGNKSTDNSLIGQQTLPL